MRRTTDRIQALLRAVLLALLVIGGPIATVYAGHAVYASAARTAHAQAMAWHRVPAITLRVGPVATLWQRPDTTGPATLSVQWTTPQGTSGTGEIAGRADAVPGSLTQVWIDKAGRLTAQPLSRTDVWERVIEVVAVIAAALILLLSAISWAASAVLGRYRLARWGAEWLAVEPQWTGRR
jgi:hypothetical protein